MLNENGVDTTAYLAGQYCGPRLYEGLPSAVKSPQPDFDPVGHWVIVDLQEKSVLIRFVGHLTERD